jgi:glycosyltransferase involved in cell wall biosynthesis
MTKKICILTQSHLCRNPRVVKEANAFAKAGYQVTILTTFTYADLLEEDLKLIDTAKISYKGIINMIPGQASNWYRLKERIKRRIAGELIGRLKLENVHALGYDFNKNLRAAIREKADLYTCHQEASTVIGCKLIQKGFKVAFDFEDWYSHDLLPEANSTRPIRLLEKSERFALQHAALSYTTSESLSAALAVFAKCNLPKVLHNVFPLSERDLMDGKFLDRQSFDLPSIHWYSQTIGPGRGLEFLVETLSALDKPIQLHLRGNVYGDFKETLTQLFPFNKGHQLHFHKLVPHFELLSRIAEHDIGLAVEEYVPDSRNLTITNKILQYLLAGIVVVATDTAGQKEVASLSPAVFLFRNKDKSSLIETLNKLLCDLDKLQINKDLALKSAQEVFCWEKQEAQLIKWVSEII